MFDQPHFENVQRELSFPLCAERETMGERDFFFLDFDPCRHCYITFARWGQTA